MSKKSAKLRLNEVYFVVYTTPSPMTRTASISDRETILFKVMPDNLMKELNRLNADFEYHVDKYLKKTVPGKLYFLKYPLKKNKPLFEKLVKEFNEKYEEFAEKVYAQIDKIKAGVREFCRKYSVEREETPSFPLEELKARFRIRLLPLPFKFDEPIIFDLISQEEKKAIEDEVKGKIEAAYRETLNEELSVFFKALAAQMQRLKSGKMVTGQTLRKLMALYEEAETALSVTDDKRYTPTFELMGEYLKKISVQHEEYRTAQKDKTAAGEIVAETLQVTRDIVEKAKPVLSDFKQLVFKEIEAKPIKRERDQSLRDLIQEIKL